MTTTTRPAGGRHRAPTPDRAALVYRLLNSLGASAAACAVIAAALIAIGAPPA